MTRNAEFFFRLHFGRESVTIPPEPALDTFTTHCLVTRDRVFHISSEKVSVVWQTIGERGPVIEDKLVFTLDTRVVGFNRRLESAVC